MDDLKQSLQQIVNDCLERRGDRFYATQAGRHQLQRWLDDKRIPLRAVVTEDERYDLEPKDG